MLSTKKLKTMTIVTGIVGLMVLTLGNYMSDEWSDFFSGMLVGMGGTWVVIAAAFLIYHFKKK